VSAAATGAVRRASGSASDDHTLPDALASGKADTATTKAIAATKAAAMQIDDDVVIMEDDGGSGGASAAAAAAAAAPAGKAKRGKRGGAQPSAADQPGPAVTFTEHEVEEVRGVVLLRWAFVWQKGDALTHQYGALLHSSCTVAHHHSPPSGLRPNKRRPPFPPPKARTSLVSWYDRVHRVLPWRRNLHSKLPAGGGGGGEAQGQAAPEGLSAQDFAYRVWVSEIMLQQVGGGWGGRVR